MYYKCLVSTDPKVSPRQRPPSPARSPNDVALRQIIAEKTKLEGEILGYKSKIKGQDAEIIALKEKVRFYHIFFSFYYCSFLTNARIPHLLNTKKHCIGLLNKKEGIISF